MENLRQFLKLPTNKKTKVIEILFNLLTIKRIQIILEKEIRFKIHSFFGFTCM